MASKDSKVLPGNAYAGAGLSDCIKSGNLAAGKIHRRRAIAAVACERDLKPRRWLP